LFGERVAEAVAVATPHGVDVKNVAASRSFLRQTKARGIQRLDIPTCDRAAFFGPRLEVPQLHPEDGALDAVHPVIESLQPMFIPGFLSPVPEHTARRREIVSRRRDRAAL